MGYYGKFFLYSVAMFFLLLSIGCSSKSMVRTNPPGGDVYQVDVETGKEIYLGREPVQIEGRAFKTYYLRGQKDDYSGTLTVKARELDAERAALGCCACGVPGLLGAGMVLPDQITILMYEGHDASKKEQIIESEPSHGQEPKKLQ